MIEYGSYDIGEKELLDAISSSNSPELLKELVDLSRLNFGWFNKRQTRVDEYVWISNQINSFKNAKALDIGAGISPLPIYIAQKNNTVITIDNSEIKRILGENQKDWNGWGYLDYNKINKNIHSYNCDINQATFDPQSFDYVYSVSVIEHFPSNARKQLWHMINHWSKPSASLLITVDLIPGTSYLWNYANGIEIESRTAHGNIDELISELLSSGFDEVSTDILRDYTDLQRTDLGLLHFKKPNK